MHIRKCICTASIKGNVSDMIRMHRFCVWEALMKRHCVRKEMKNLYHVPEELVILILNIKIISLLRNHFIAVESSRQ